MFADSKVRLGRLAGALLVSSCAIVLPAAVLRGSSAEAGALSTARVAGPSGGTVIATVTPTHPLTCTPSWTPTVTATPTGPTVTPTRTGSPTSTRTSTAIPTPGPCVQPINEDFESGTLGIFSSSGSPGWSAVTNGPHGGMYSAYAPDVPNVSDQQLAVSTPISVPANGHAVLTFWQRYDLEKYGDAAWDGGVLEASTDGGFNWVTPDFSEGGYNSTLVDCPSTNPLAGRPAWSGNSGGWVHVTVQLPDPSPVFGRMVQFRFRLGTDAEGAAGGWWIDDLTISFPQSFCYTPTGTRTVSATPSLSPSATLTPTISATPSQTAGAASATSTMTQAASNTPTSTATMTATATATPSGTPEWCWTEAYPQQPGSTSNALYAIDAASTSQDVWAVGEADGQPLIENGIGSGAAWWSLTWPISGTLKGVAAVAPDNIWAVGQTVTSTLIMHGSGINWEVVPSPNVGTGENVLNAISAVSTDDIWAVGSSGSANARQTLVLHWDGATWSIVSSPNPGTDNMLNGVKAISANDVWAVGSQINVDSLVLTMHWNGTAWSVVSTQLYGDRVSLNAVDATGPNAVWAVGSSWDDLTRWEVTLLLFWNGSNWSRVTSPTPAALHGRMVFYGVDVLSNNDMWAVGYYTDTYDGGRRSVVSHWNGTDWSTEPEPNLHGHDNTEYAVKILPSGEGAIVGTYYDRNNANKALALRRVMAPEDFSDVHPTDYFYQAVRYLVCHEVISGYADGTFLPYNNTTRGQLAKIIVIAEGYYLNTSGGPHFTDVPVSNPFYPYIETAYNAGIVNGYSDGTFRWGADVTRGQLCKIVVEAEGWAIYNTGGPHFTDVPVTNPFYDYIETAYAHGLISGYSDGTFRWGNSATRGQIAKIVFNAVTGT